MIKAIIFDFDGVILESVDIKTEAFRELFRDYPLQVDHIVTFHLNNAGVSRYDKFEVIYRDYLGLQIDQTEIARLDREFSAIVYRHVLTCPFVPGAFEFLKVAAGRYQLFVASATPQAELQDIVDRRDLSAYFRGVYGSPATKSLIVRTILADHEIDPAGVLFIGDATSDLSAATDSSVSFLGRVRPGSSNPFPQSIPVVDSLEPLLAEPDVVERFGPQSEAK